MLSMPGIGDLRLAEQGSLPPYPPRGILSITGEALWLCTEVAWGPQCDSCRVQMAGIPPSTKLTRGS